MNFSCWKMPRNFTQITSLSPHCHSYTCRMVQLGFLIPVSCSLCFCVDPSLLAKAAGPGCCSEAAGMPSPTDSRLSECISLLQIKRYKQKKLKRAGVRMCLWDSYRPSLIIFLVCGGVQTDPCISFLQNGIEPKCLYLGVPPSGNNRKIYPRFCQNLRERALSNICDDDKTAHFSFTHASWSNAVNFIVLVPNFLVFGKTPALYVKYSGKSQLGNQLWLNMESHPRCQASLTKPHAVVHAHHSCISELGRGDVAGGIQCP